MQGRLAHGARSGEYAMSDVRSGKVIQGVAIGCLCAAVLGVALLGVGGYVAYRLGKAIALDTFEGLDPDEYPWEECEVAKLDGSRVVFLRRPAHPFLAEYFRKIRLERPGQPDETLPLPMNVGGRTKINVYRLPAGEETGHLFILRDHWGDYAVDPIERRTLLLEKVDGRVFSGPVQDEGTVGASVMRWKEDGVEKVEVRIGGEMAVDLTDARPFERMEYLGRIDGSQGPPRFVPASAAAEERIEKVMED